MQSHYLQSSQRSSSSTEVLKVLVTEKITLSISSFSIIPFGVGKIASFLVHFYFWVFPQWHILIIWVETLKIKTSNHWSYFSDWRQRRCQRLPQARLRSSRVARCRWVPPACSPWRKVSEHSALKFWQPCRHVYVKDSHSSKMFFLAEAFHMHEEKKPCMNFAQTKQGYDGRHVQI